jgi:hypothetical protein
MEPQEYLQLIERLLEDATYRKRVLAQAAEAKEKEIAHITASGHITDDKPNAQPVYTVQEELESWEEIVSALTAVRTALHRIT